MSAPSHNRDSLPVRILRALSVVTVDPPAQESQFVAGSDFATAEAVHTAYDPRRAASALLANPWYWRAVSIRASSLAALPLQVQRQTADGWEADESHPLAALLERVGGKNVARWWLRKEVEIPATGFARKAWQATQAEVPSVLQDALDVAYETPGSIAGDGR